MNRRRLRLCVVLALVGLVPVGAATQRSAPASPAPGSAAVSSTALLDILRTEMDRNVEVLKKEPVPPYFMAYTVSEVRSTELAASFGAMVVDNDSQSRTLGVDIRTGDYALDNTHEIRGEPAPPTGLGRSSIPLTDSAPGVGVAAWLATDRAYRQSVERLARVKTNLAAMVKEEDPAPDFSREEPQVFVGHARLRSGGQGRVESAASPVVRAVRRRPAHPAGRRHAQRRSEQPLPGQHRGQPSPDGRHGLPADGPGTDEGGRRHGAAGLRHLLRPIAVWPSRRGEARRGRAGAGRHAGQTPRGAGGRPVLRAGDPLGARGRGLLPRDLRPPDRGVPAEDRRRCADVREDGGAVDPASVPGCRGGPDAPEARRHGAGRLLPVRRRGRACAPGAGREGRRARRVPHEPVAARALPQVERPRARPAGAAPHLPPVEPHRRVVGRRAVSAAGGAAEGGSAEGGEIVRPAVRPGGGRLHVHRALHAECLQRDAHHRVPRLRGRPPAGTRAGRRPDRHAALRVRQDRRDRQQDGDVQRHLRRRERPRAGVGLVAGAARVGGRGPEEAEVAGHAAAAAGAGQDPVVRGRIPRCSGR